MADEEGVQDMNTESSQRAMPNRTYRPDHLVITTSQLEMLWLTKVKGFTVIQTNLIPRQNTLGQIRYTRRWMLDGAEK